MQLAMIGLGKMGFNMTHRLLRGGHQIVGFAHDPRAIEAAALPAARSSGAETRRTRRLLESKKRRADLSRPVEPLGRLRRFLEEEGKDFDSFMVSGRLMVGNSGPKEWVEHTRRLYDAGIRDMEIFPGGGLTGNAAAAKIVEARDVLSREFG